MNSHTYIDLASYKPRVLHIRRSESSLSSPRGWRVPRLDQTRSTSRADPSGWHLRAFWTASGPENPGHSIAPGLPCHPGESHGQPVPRTDSPEESKPRTSASLFPMHARATVTARRNLAPDDHDTTSARWTPKKAMSCLMLCGPSTIARTHCQFASHMSLALLFPGRCSALYFTASTTRVLPATRTSARGVGRVFNIRALTSRGPAPSEIPAQLAIRKHPDAVSPWH